MIKSYKSFINESIKDLMKPKSKSEIGEAIKSLFINNPLGFLKKYKFNYQELINYGITESEMYEMIDKYSDSLIPLLNLFNKSNKDEIISEFKKIVWYLFTEGYLYSSVDNNNVLWFIHIKKRTFEGGVISVNKFTKLKNVMEYVNKHKTTNESITDLMKPKSKEQIDNELDKLDPFKKLTIIFNRYLNDILDEEEPYYNQKQIDDLIPKYIEICNNIFNIDEKIKHLHKYYNLSVLIRKELKNDLVKLPASKQLEYLNNINLDYLNGLYTDKEWNDLRLKVKDESTNESITDLMKPKSIEDIKKKLSEVPDDKLLGILYDNDIELEDVYTEEEIFNLDPEVLLDYSFRKNYMKGIRYVLDTYRLYGKNTKFIVTFHICDIESNNDLKELINNEQISRLIGPEQKFILEKYRLGMHQNVKTDYEERLINHLDNKTVYYQSEKNPSIMIGTNKKEDKNYFNYNKDSKLLTYHLDNFVFWVTDVNDENNYESHRGDDLIKNNKYGIYSKQIKLILKYVFEKYYNIEIDKVNGSRNDAYSFIEK